MGTTLTGTTPQDTYDSLIKVTDNGPLTGSLKKLTDGLGNDSSLSLSTTAASLSGNLTSTGSASFTGSVASASSAGEQAILQGGYLQFYNAAATNKFIKLTDDSSTIDAIGFSKSGAASTIWFPTGNVGIGTSAPTGTYGKLTVAGTGITMSADGSGKLEIGRYSAGTPNSYIKLGSTSGSLRISNAADAVDIVVIENNTTGEKLRVLESGGITFNGDTAAANALDDYEEGTWTPVINGAGGNPTVTYTAFNTGGIYTKIGNKVTVSFEVRWSSLSGGSGAVSIAGLPFARRTTAQPDGDRLIIDSYDNTISGKYLTGNVGSSQSSIALSMVNSAAAPTDLSISNLATSALGFLRGTVTYFV
jgi:hypothetical protein